MGLSAGKASLLVAVLLAASLLPRGLGAARPFHTADGGEVRRLIGDVGKPAVVRLRGHGAARPLPRGPAAAGDSAPSNAGGSALVSPQGKEEGGGRRPVARRVLLRGVNADASKSKPSCGSNYEPPCHT